MTGGPATPPRSPGRPPARRDTRLDDGWRFRGDDVPGAEQADFDDGDWEAVSLPHNWGWEEAQRGRDYRRGPGWYRHALGVERSDGSRRRFVRFEAAGSVADVYLNGRRLGSHRGAFGAFCFEWTPDCPSAGHDVLAVRVSNAPEPDVAPLSGDFCVFGGLYRPVHVIETGAICVSPTDHGSPGVVWRQMRVGDRRASIDVIAGISNGTVRAERVIVAATVLDASGRRVAGAEAGIEVTPDATAPCELRVEIAQPRLWNGRVDPYLHRAIVELRAAGGAVLDRVEQPLGVRCFEVDADRGFLLNGMPCRPHGVGLHQDRPDKGWAISEADQEEDVRLILEMGCTAVRCAHYQHSDFFYDLCDRNGLLVWAELPVVDVIDGSPRFAETTRGQLLDLIRQTANHPSIFTWGLCNELRPGGADPRGLLCELNALAHAEDPTRPTAAATSTADLPQLNEITDLLGWNLYPGWYPDAGALTDYGRILDDRRGRGMHGGFCVSEYGAGANVAHHEQAPAQPEASGPWHPEEWQAVVHEEAWSRMRSRPFIWATFVWNMFDFTAHLRNEGGVPGRNDKGLVAYDRKVRKDAFHFYMASWSDEPILHIASRRHTHRDRSITHVKVYSNAPEVELLVNGRSRGARRADREGVFVWQGVRLTPGANRIEARASRDEVPLHDACVWTLEDAPGAAS